MEFHIDYHLKQMKFGRASNDFLSHASKGIGDSRHDIVSAINIANLDAGYCLK